MRAAERAIREEAKTLAAQIGRVNAEVAAVKDAGLKTAEESQKALRDLQYRIDTLGVKIATLTELVVALGGDVETVKVLVVPPTSESPAKRAPRTRRPPASSS